LALSSIHANIVESESKHGNCLIRNQIKREVEYFCDEMASVCTSYKFLGAKMFTLSLATMGKFLLQSAYLPFVVYAPIFRRLNNQIVEMVTTLREIYHENIVSASGKNTPGLGSSKKQPFTSVISSQKSQLEGKNYC
jgi:hypothetical protein